jgi:hypothetical protein
LVTTVAPARRYQVAGDPMTLPVERMRAIRFGFEMFNDAVCDHELPPAMRQRAQLVLEHYPHNSDLEEHLTRDRATLPSKWVAVLIDARMLLVDLHLVIVRFLGARGPGIAGRGRFGATNLELLPMRCVDIPDAGAHLSPRD